MPQDWFNLIPRPKREYEGPIQLPQTPLEETNPVLASIQNRIGIPIRDFLGNFTGLGKDRGVLAPEGEDTTGGLLGDAAGVLNPAKMIGPLIGMTRFMNITNDAGKLVKTPDVARRMAQTSHRMDQLYSSLQNAGASEADIAKAMEIAGRYPRTLAHTGEIGLVNPRDMKMNQRAAGITHLPPGRNMPDLLLNRNQVPHEMANNQVNQLHGVPDIPIEVQTPFAQTFAHELQHVGQILPNTGRMLRGYSDAERSVGYKRNPYEVAARIGSIKRAYGNLPSVMEMFRRNK
jgi:hypothetical protein